jgi:type IV secretory pathway VirB2 component (pilin)
MTNLDKTTRTDSNLAWSLIYFFGFSLIFINTTGEVAAEDVIGNTLCNITSALTGQIASAIATMAIFTVGVSLFMGKMQWGTAAATAAGVGIIFGSSKLIAWITGDSENQNCGSS